MEAIDALHRIITISERETQNANSFTLVQFKGVGAMVEALKLVAQFPALSAASWRRSKGFGSRRYSNLTLLG